MEDLSCSNWKIVQTKTFTKWVNNKLKKANFPTITDLFSDLSSGVALAQLLIALGKNIENYNQNPFSRIQKVENLSIILDYLKSINISLVNIGPTDIVDGNQKLILGLIWTLISKISISDVLANEIFSIKEEIFYWTKRIAKDYKNVNIENLSTSWQNGIGFNAIIHKYRPGLVPNFFELDPENSYSNCEQAFNIAEDKLGIPKLFDPEDIIDVSKPDERSILTYLSQFYQKFMAEEKEMLRKKNLYSLIKAISQSFSSRNDYERKAEEFLNKKEAMIERMNSIKVLFKTFIEELAFIEQMNNSLIVDSVELYALFDLISHTNKIFNIKKYTPPEHLNVNNIEANYLKLTSFFDMDKLAHLISEFSNSEAEEINRLKDLSRQIYSTADSKAQIELIGKSEKAFSEMHLNSPAKQAIYEKMKVFFEEIKGRANKTASKRDQLMKVLDEAKSLLKTKNTNNAGFASGLEVKRLFRLLKLEPNEFIQSCDLNCKISMDKLADAIESTVYPSFKKDQIKAIFGDQEKLDLTEIVPNLKLQNLKNILDSDNCVAYENIEIELND